jgi:hypothetical protein
MAWADEYIHTAAFSAILKAEISSIGKRKREVCVE